MTNTPKNKTLITGQLLQIRDKLMAKRHLIPKSCQAEWEHLSQQTAVFDAAELAHLQPGSENALTKSTSFAGTINDLLNMVEAMRNLDRQIKLAAH